MCQEIHLSDVRSALSDYCEEYDSNDTHPQLDDLIAQFENAQEDGFVHLFDHVQRARQLASTGDHSAAAIHRALSASMAGVTC